MVKIMRVISDELYTALMEASHHKSTSNVNDASVLYSQNSNGRRIHTNACPIALHSLRFNSAWTIKKCDVELSMECIENLLPNNYKNRGRKLLFFFKATDCLKWQNTGEIIVNDILINDSHIVDYTMFCICGEVGQKKIPSYWREVKKCYGF